MKKLRKSLGFTQSQFGKTINLTDAMISMIESGKYPLQPGTLKLICLTFGINESWLLTGEGPMKDDEILFSEKYRRLLYIFKQLSPRVQDMLVEYAEKLLSDEQELRRIAQSEKGEMDIVQKTKAG